MPQHLRLFVVQSSRRFSRMDLLRKAKEKLKSVHNLERRLEFYKIDLDNAIRRSGPKGIAPIDLSRPAVKSSAREDDYSSADQIAYIQRKIMETEDEIKMINSVVEALEPEQQQIIELWYFEKMKKEEIAEKLHYSGFSTIYRKRDQALLRFAQIFPW